MNLIRLLLLGALLSFSAPLLSQNKDGGVQRSPKPGWGDFEVVEEDTSYPWWAEVLLWPVNRILDLTDALHVDAGVGTAKGAVLRITKPGSVGYRSVAPGSLRVGSFGRDYPVMIESSSEFGIGPGYVHSKDRDTCGDEIGVGVDLFVGAYVGICPLELFDFIGGIFFLDPSDDDIR